MQQLIAVAIAGLVAQLVDGALGMGYGLTSSTLLIATGLTPAAASASVHLAEVGTTAVSGVAHHRFNNVDWHAVRRIAIPGGIGAFLGATFLSSISTEFAKPLASSLLFTLGIYVLLRFVLGKVRVARTGRPSLRFLAPLGLIGGFVDATGGGGWGPVTTPTLLADGRLAPNRVIGTVSATQHARRDRRARPRWRHGSDRRVHALHLLCGGTRDHPPETPRSDTCAHDARSCL